MSIMTVNGKRIETSGKNISILNDKIIIDGEILLDGLSGAVDIRFEGSLESFNCDCSATTHSNIMGRFNIGTPK